MFGIKHLDDLVRENSYDFAKFMGRTDDVSAALRHISDTMPQTESFSISILEATTASKPVIVAQIGAIGDFVAEGKSGLFVDWDKSD